MSTVNVAREAAFASWTKPNRQARAKICTGFSAMKRSSRM